jgi:hypothetical protein
MEYGNQTTSPSVEATESTAPVAEVSAGVYSWDTLQQKAVVHNHPDSAFYIYLVWNDDASAPTAAPGCWDRCLAGGDSAESPDGIAVERVGIYISAAPGTGYKTDYSVRGWK